jgi:polyhydroxyalkanoate synthesis regulator phasin
VINLLAPSFACEAEFVRDVLQAARSAGHEGHERRQLTKFKEKNRTAQKRYRERQKSKLSESEERVAELAAQLQQLQTEKVPHCL